MKEVQGRGGFVVLSKLRAVWHLEFFGNTTCFCTGELCLVGNVLSCTVTISVIMNDIYPDNTFDIFHTDSQNERASERVKYSPKTLE